MDEEVVDVKRWTELENVRTYYDFFKKYENEFHGMLADIVHQIPADIF